MGKTEKFLWYYMVIFLEKYFSDFAWLLSYSLKNKQKNTSPILDSKHYKMTSFKIYN